MPTWLPATADAVLFIEYSVTAIALMLWVRRHRTTAPVRLISILVVVLALFAVSRLLRLAGVDDGMREWVRMGTSVAVGCALVVVLLMIRPGLGAAEAVFDREALERAYEEERRSRFELEAERAELESRSAQLTLKYRRISDAIAATYVIALQWKVESGEVEWEVGYSSAAHHLNLPHASFDHWRVFLDASGIEQLKSESRQAIRNNGGRLEFAKKIAGPPDRNIRLSAMAVPEVKGEPASMVGMMRVVVCEPTPDPPLPPR